MPEVFAQLSGARKVFVYQAFHRETVHPGTIYPEMAPAARARQHPNPRALCAVVEMPEVKRLQAAHVCDSDEGVSPA